MRTITLTLCSAILLFAVSATAAEKHFSKQFAVSPGGTLRLTTDVGSVQVVGTSSNQVSVVAEINGNEKAVSKFEITAEQSGSDVEVEGRSERSHFWSWTSDDLDVTIKIEVPRQYNIKLKTSGGDIKVATVTGTVDGKTSGGNVDARDIEGTTGLNTSGGNVYAEKINGNVRLETSGGEVTAEGVTGDLDAWTSGGNVKITNADGKVKAQTSGGNVTVRLKSQNKGVFAETSGGNIELAMAKDASANIDASTSGGEVYCDLPVTMSGHLDEDVIKGKLNGGGNTVQLHTSGGDIHIRALP